MWEQVRDELRKAVDELSMAEHHFHEADPDYIDVAIEGLKLAELRYSIALQKAKLYKNSMYGKRGRA